MARDVRNTMHTRAGGASKKTAGSSISAALDVQSEAWRRGEPVAIEELMQGRATSDADAETALDLIHHEVILRNHSGESPRPADYLSRFPHLISQIERMFEVEGYF